MKFNYSSLVGHGEAFGDEGGAHCGLGELIKLVVGKPCQYATLTNATISYSYSFDLLDWFLC